MKPICSVCTKEIKDGQRFAGQKSEKGWEVQHEECIDPRGAFAALPRFFMTPARLWVLTK